MRKLSSSVWWTWSGASRPGGATTSSSVYWPLVSAAVARTVASIPKNQRASPCLRPGLVVVVDILPPLDLGTVDPRSIISEKFLSTNSSHQMSPRRYDMSKRAAAVEETRRRIVEATIDLHTSKGILATSWEEIARRADVAPATVYRHFPTLDELLPACGELGMRQLALPSDEEIAELFRGTRSRRERLRRLVDEVFGLYGRGGDVLRAVRRERALLPPLQDDYERIEERLDALA